MSSSPPQKNIHTSHQTPAHQREALLDAIVPRQYTDECVCEHTLHITDAQGNRRGSWADQYIGVRWRVVCRCCGRFYGYHPDGYEPESPESTGEQTPSDSQKEYLDRKETEGRRG